MKNAIENILLAIGCAFVIMLFLFILFVIFNITPTMQAFGTGIGQLFFFGMGIIVFIVFGIYLWAMTFGVRDKQDWF